MYYLSASTPEVDLVNDDPHPITITGTRSYNPGPLGEVDGSLIFGGDLRLTIPNLLSSDMELDKSFTVLMQVSHRSYVMVVYKSKLS